MQRLGAGGVREPWRHCHAVAIVVSDVDRVAFERQRHARTAAAGRTCSSLASCRTRRAGREHVCALPAQRLDLRRLGTHAVATRAALFLPRPSRRWATAAAETPSRYCSAVAFVSAQLKIPHFAPIEDVPLER
jgi:hypothetical protein